MLENVLGLNHIDTLTYRAVLSSPASSFVQLQQSLKLAPADLSSSLATLTEWGLISRGQDEAWSAAPPAIALGAIINARRSELESAELQVPQLESAYRASLGHRGPAGVIDMVYGTEAVARRLAQLQLGAVSSVESFVKPPVLAVSAEDNIEEEQALGRGVQYRALVETSMVRSGEITANDVSTARANGEEVRVTDELPVKLLIIDRRLAYIPLHATQDPCEDAQPQGSDVAALVIHPSSLLEALIELWDLLWARATPFSTEAPASPKAQEDTADQFAASTPQEIAGLEPGDTTVLSLLLMGLTDEAIAKQLGTSPRTVQRRIRRLMDAAGARTRLQLGWYAACSNWLPN